MNLYSLFSILSCLYQPFCFDNSKSPSEMNLVGIPLDYSPMQLVVPSAVNTAEIIDARICSVHLSVSFFVISYLLSD